MDCFVLRTNDDAAPVRITIYVDARTLPWESVVVPHSGSADFTRRHRLAAFLNHTRDVMLSEGLANCTGHLQEVRSSWIVPDADSHSDASAVVQAAAARLNLLLKSYCTGGCKLSPGEAQAALCIYIYACQTYLTGSNAGHPRDRFGVVKATSIGILAQLKKKAKI